MSDTATYHLVDSRWVKGVALIPTYVVGLSIANHFGGIVWVVAVVGTLLLSELLARSTFERQKVAGSAAKFWTRFAASFLIQLLFYMACFLLLSTFM